MSPPPPSFWGAGNLKCVCVDLSWVNHGVIHGSPRSHEEGCFTQFLKWKRLGGFFNGCCFPDVQGDSIVASEDVLLLGGERKTCLGEALRT